MPHATMPATGFQAIILCGPGESLNPFNSNPKDFPKALIPIANRPMVWYPLDWCHRMGVTNIHLVTPPESLSALEAALSQNPHLTSLPSPKPSVLAPEDVTLTTGTAEIFRSQQVQDAITGDFIVLPCDILCELNGVSLLESWMTLQGSLGSSHWNTADSKDFLGGGEADGRRGGLGVWYETKDSAEGDIGVKKEETDFLVTTDLPAPIVPPADGSLRPYMRNVVMAMPTAVLKDEVEEKKGLRVRPQLPRRHKREKSLASHRDAHIYFFPYWVKEFMRRNDTFESLSEDVIGWWVKARWQLGLERKLGLHEILDPEKTRAGNDSAELNGSIDVGALSSTLWDGWDINETSRENNTSSDFASRVRGAQEPTRLPETDASGSKTLKIPSMLSYLHPARPVSSLIRRIDTVPLLLNASLFLAKLSSVTESQQTQPQDQAHQRPPSPFSHTHKVPPNTTIPAQLTLHTQTVLLDANVTLMPKSTIRESVIGANCVLGSPSSSGGPGVRLNGCLLMEGAVVESGAVLNRCVLGRRSRIGRGSDLRDCYVQEGYVVPDGTTSKGEVFAGFDEEAGDMEEGEDLYGDAEEDDVAFE